MFILSNPLEPKIKKAAFHSPIANQWMCMNCNFQLIFIEAKKNFILDNDNVDTENNYCIDYWISPHIDSLSCKIYINAYKLLINSNWNYVCIISASLNNVFIKCIAFYCVFFGVNENKNHLCKFYANHLLQLSEVLDLDDLVTVASL